MSFNEERTLNKRDECTVGLKCPLIGSVRSLASPDWSDHSDGAVSTRTEYQYALDRQMLVEIRRTGSSGRRLVRTDGRIALMGRRRALIG